MCQRECCIAAGLFLKKVVCLVPEESDFLQSDQHLLLLLQEVGAKPNTSSLDVILSPFIFSTSPNVVVNECKAPPIS